MFILSILQLLQLDEIGVEFSAEKWMHFPTTQGAPRLRRLTLSGLLASKFRSGEICCDNIRGRF